MGITAVQPNASDWQKFYVPATQGFGDSPEYTAEVNAARLREAMLQAQQLQQATLTTQGMQPQGTSSTSSSSIASGSYSMPGVTGGSYSMPNIGGTGIQGNFSGMPTSYITSAGGGSNTQPVSEQLRYDPWSAFRDDAAVQLNDARTGTDPSQVFQSKLAEMANGTFSPDDPSYRWRYDQGQQAVERSLAAKGLLNSGNAAIELQQYGQGAASQEYGAQFDRMLKGLTASESAYDSSMQRLMKMAGVDIDPTAGGMLNVAQGNLGVSQGELGVKQAGLGLEAQQMANQYDLGMRELVLKQMLAQQAQNGNVGGTSGTNWSAIFNT